MKKISFLKVVTLIILYSLAISCASTTLIKTNDRNVKIYADGQYLGKGEATYTSTKIVGSSTVVGLKKDGCEEKVYTISRNEEFSAGACLGGVLVLIPFLWVMDYKPVHQYEFECGRK